MDEAAEIERTRKSGGIPRVSTRFILSITEPNLSCEAKFIGKNVDRKKTSSCSADHEQDWQLYPVDP